MHLDFSGLAKSYIFFSVLHFLEFVLAITVICLYAVDLNRARLAGQYIDTKWLYAEIVGALSAVTALALMVPWVLRVAAAFLWVWGLALFILWIALFGVFGKMYIHEDPEGNSDIQRMKNSVWVDLINALLWLVGSLLLMLYWLKHREHRSRFTGRAKV